MSLDRLIPVVVALVMLLPPTPGQGERPPPGVAADQFLPLPYGDGGGVWLPRELAHGGRAPVIVVLHGNNRSRTSPVSVGGGRRLGELLRSLIDSGQIPPIVLAEPVHFQTCRTGLYDDHFDFFAYRADLERVLRQHRVRVTSYSVTGHSGAGCCDGILRAARAFGPLRFVGLIDTCYRYDRYAADLHTFFDGHAATVINVSRGEPGYTAFRDFERAFLGPGALGVACDAALYRRCLRSASEPFFSFVTRRLDAKYHSDIPIDYYRSIMPRVFGRQQRYRRSRPWPRQARTTRGRSERGTRASSPRARPRAR